MKKTLCSFLAFVFTFTTLIPNSYAQSVFMAALPEPGKMLGLSETFTPILVKGLVIHPDKPLNFDFIVDTGNDTTEQTVIKEQSEKIVKYFLAALTVPEESLWVNLSPYEKDRVIADGLGQTLLGRDMLAQDYVLKQLTASIIYPEDKLGKAFWTRIYKEAQEKFGTTDIPVDTFNKVWIVPQKAVVFEKDNAVYVTEAKLKVMLDSDYLAAQHNASAVTGTLPLAGSNTGNNTGTLPLVGRDREGETVKNLIRQLILPAIEKEVNQGKNFATLRQVYYAAILAKWYRELVQDTLMFKAYVGQNKITGVNSDDKTLKEQIYQRYIAAYKKGVFNYIKEENDGVSGPTIPRKYFSGGLDKFGDINISRTGNAAMLSGSIGKLFSILFGLRPDVSEAAREVLKPSDAASFTPPPVDATRAKLAPERQRQVRATIKEAHLSGSKKIVQFISYTYETEDGRVGSGVSFNVHFKNGEAVVPEGMVDSKIMVETAVNPVMRTLRSGGAPGSDSVFAELARALGWKVMNLSFKGELIAKSQLLEIGSIRETILSPNHKDSIWEEVSSTEVRLKPNLGIKKKAIEKMLPSEDVDRIWSIVQWAQGHDDYLGHPDDRIDATLEERQIAYPMLESVLGDAFTSTKPYAKSRKYWGRNWYQVKDTQEVFGVVEDIRTLFDFTKKDDKSDYDLEGTGVTMALAMEKVDSCKQVFVYSQKDNQWYVWDRDIQESWDKDGEGGKKQLEDKEKERLKVEDKKEYPKVEYKNNIMTKPLPRYFFPVKLDEVRITKEHFTGIGKRWRNQEDVPVILALFNRSHAVQFVGPETQSTFSVQAANVSIKPTSSFDAISKIDSSNFAMSVFGIQFNPAAMFYGIKYYSTVKKLRFLGREDLEKSFQDPKFLRSVVLLARYGYKSACKALFESERIEARAAFQLWADENWFTDEMVIKSGHLPYRLNDPKSLEWQVREFRLLIDLLLTYKGETPIYGNPKARKEDFGKVSNKQHFLELRERLRTRMPYVLQETWGKQGVLDVQLYLANRGYASDWLRKFFSQREKVWSLLSQKKNRRMAMEAILGETLNIPSLDGFLSIHGISLADKDGDKITRMLFGSFFLNANLAYYYGSHQFESLIDKIIAATPEEILKSEVFVARVKYAKQWSKETESILGRFDGYFNVVWDRFRQGYDFHVRSHKLFEKTKSLLVWDALRRYPDHVYKVGVYRVELVSGKKVIASFQEEGDIDENVYHMNQAMKNKDGNLQQQISPGGVAINHIGVEKKTSGARIQFNDAAMKAVLDNGFEGFTPVFIRMTPVESPLMIMGAAQAEIKEGKV